MTSLCQDQEYMPLKFIIQYFIDLFLETIKQLKFQCVKVKWEIYFWDKYKLFT